MRYIKLEKAVKNEKDGQISGTIPILMALLLNRCPAMKSYDNQLKMWKFSQKIESLKETDTCLELEEADWAWLKSMLKECSFEGVMAGKLIADIDDPPNRKPE